MSAEQTIFCEALAKESPQQRAQYLAQACAGDVALRARVEELLAAQERAGAFLESPPPGVTLGLGEELPPPGPPDAAGSTVGPYKLLEQIGEGGMGVVFMAEQTRPVRRRVAVKIIKPGMDTKQVIARFEAERQALALMDHPNIAKVFDAGATDAGRLYFAMELVRGLPITDYCDQQQLPPRQRLALFVQVCRAVQHAHQKGIIHRDLKPNNVLVTVADDGRPVPKVIDFGIAKATTAGQRLTDQTLFTHFQQMIGTPLYMSPEQAEMNAVTDVDTRSDVYSLGVLLYELLTGTTPFDKQRLAKAAYDEVRRILREEEPPRPSTRISTLGETLTSISTHRRTDPKRLGQVVRGELDWIVMRALEKDRARRYDTANGLARDVERYLEDQPVEACPPSRIYRMRKFVRRNKAAMTTTALIAAVLVLATGVSSWQAVLATRAERNAEQERDVATGERNAAAAALREKEAALAAEKRAHAIVAMQSSLHNLLLENYRDIAQLWKESTTIRQVIDRTVGDIDQGVFAADPLRELSARRILQSAYAVLGLTTGAERQMREIVKLVKGGAPNPDWGYKRSYLRGMPTPAQRLALDLQDLAQYVVDPQERKALYLEALAEVEKEPDHVSSPVTADILVTLVDALRQVKEVDAAAPYEQRIVEVVARLPESSDPEMVGALRRWGRHLRRWKKPAEAEQLLRRALAMAENLPELNESIRANVQLELAQALRDQEKSDEAAQVDEVVSSLFGGVRREHAATVALDLYELAWDWRSTPRVGERLIRASMELRQRSDDPQRHRLKNLNTLAVMLQDQLKISEAETVYREAIEEALNHNDREAVAHLLVNLATLRGHVADVGAAELLFREAFAINRDVFGPGHRKVVTSGSQLAGLLINRGEVQEAERIYQQLLRAQRDHRPFDPDFFAGVAGRYIAFLERAGRSAEALPLWREIVHYRHAHDGAASAVAARAKLNLARLLVKLKQYQEAASWLEQLALPAQEAYLAPDARSERDKLIAESRAAQPDTPGTEPAPSAEQTALRSAAQESEAVRKLLRNIRAYESASPAATIGDVIILDDFEEGLGRFGTLVMGAGTSGTTVGIASSSMARRSVDYAFRGSASQVVMLDSKPREEAQGFIVRHLSSAGMPVNNVQLGTTGSVGFLMRTETSGLQASIMLDENLATSPPNIERAKPKNLIPDGNWHLYSWDLADPEQWEAFAGGNGVVDGPITTVDSISILSQTNQDAVVYLDTVFYSPIGPVEPAVLQQPGKVAESAASSE